MKFYPKRVRYLKDLDKLGLTPDECIIGASGAAALHGLPFKNSDLDINISEQAFKRIKKKLRPGPKDGVHDNMWTDTSGNIDINVGSNDWYNRDEMMPLTEVVDGHRYHSWEGNKRFYKKLYDLYGKEKHKVKYETMLEMEKQLMK